MRRRLYTSLCSLVAVFALAPAVARAQAAAPSSAQTKKTPPAAKKPAAKKPAAQDAAKTTKPAQDSAAAKKKAAAAAAKRQAAARAARKKDAGEAGEASTQKSDAPTKKADASAEKVDASSPDAPPREKATDASAKPASVADAPAQSSTAGAEGAKAEGEVKKSEAEVKKSEGEAKKSDPASNSGAGVKPAKTGAAKGEKKAADAQPRPFDPAKAAELKARLAEIQKLPAWERIAELKDFLDLELPDDLADRAAERLVSAEAAYGDERLQAGDAARGVELFRDAVATADEQDVSDRLFFEIVSQLPANLILRGQPAAAFDLARRVERLASGDANRLLAVAAFYVSAEQPEEAARLSAKAIKIAPDLAAAHQALATAHRLSLKLDESAAEYARAAELDPKSVAARTSLADLKRATGKPEEALAVYRELREADPQNRAARTGLVLALFDAGHKEDAERELEAALKDDPHDIQLLAGAAYWYSAHGDQKRALDLAGRVVQVEPRHPWAQVALARALIANEMPYDAERMMRFVRLYSHFPTLDYELANALAAEGFYAEAAEELGRSFTIKGDEIETRLAGRTPSSAPDFVSLLAPERRASLFEPDAADTPENARQLKGLLALHAALRATDTAEQRAAAEAPAAQAARDFASGDDAARAFRQLYAANRLLRRNVAAPVAVELINAARKGVSVAVATPQATSAVMADELRDARGRAIEQGTVPDTPDVPREVLDRIMRGRIEELTGWALMNQGRAREAVAPLRQAVGVLPENSLYWRNALWRLGNAYAASGEPQLALNTFVKSFDQENPDEARFAVIQALYRKLNGSLNGLEVLFGLAPARNASSAAPIQPAPFDPTRPLGRDAIQAPAPKSARADTDDAAGETKTGEAKPDEAKRVETKTDEPKREETKRDEPKADAAKDAAKEGESKSETKKSETKTDEPKSDEAKGSETKSGEAKSVETKSGDAAPSSAAPAAATPATPAGEKVSETKKAEGTRKRAAAPRANDAPSPTASRDASSSQSPAAESAPGQASSQGQPSDPAPRTRRASECTLAVGAEEIALKAGASATISVTLEGGGDASKITATTPNWSDIIVLREQSGDDAASAKFTVTSISKTGGSYAVTVKSPCGAKKIVVTVK